MKKTLVLLAMVLLVVMLLPAAFAAEKNTAVDASNFFAFTNEAHGLTGDTNFHLVKHTLDTHKKNVCDPWAFVNLRTGSSYGTTETGFLWRMSVGSRPLLYNPRANTSGYTTAAIAFELVFDTPGTFNPVVEYISATSSPKADFYLVDATKETKKWYATINEEKGTYTLNDSYFYADCVEGLNSADYIGTIDMYGEGSVDTATFPAKEVKAQSYYLVIIPNRQNENMVLHEEGTSKYATIQIKSFSMAPRPEAEALTYSTAFEKVINLAMLPAVNSSSTVFSTEIDGVVTNIRCMRGTNMLHYLPFASWKATYNYKALFDEKGTKIYSTAEKCEPYNTMLLDKTDPWLIENGEIPHTHSSSVSRYHTTGTAKVDSYNYDSNRSRITIRVNIPHAGKYQLQLCHNFSTKDPIGAHLQVFFGKAPYKTINGDTNRTYLSSYKYLGWFKCDDPSMANYTDFGVVDVPVGGEYIVSLCTSPEGLDETTGNPTWYGKKDDGYLDTEAEYKYSDKGYQNLSLRGIKLIPVEDTELKEVQSAHDAIASENDSLVTYEEEAGVAKATTTVNAFAAYIDGTEIDSAIIDIASAKVGGSCTVIAPEKEGYTFLYWAKAASDKKMILSRDAEYTFVPHSDAISLIAVYEKGEASASAKAEFYNANGYLIATLTEDGKTPDLPSMAGFGNATHWTLYGSAKEYAAGEDITLNGTMLFVASYGDKQKVKITASGGSVSNANPEYGEEVTVTALERSGANVFNYWTKNGEVVSFNKEYTFKAWENAELKAVYKEYKPSLSKEFRKIILGAFDSGEVGNDGVMAEFIGLEDAVEKGVMFGEVKRAPMSTKDNQYSIINDSGLTAIGYAILADGTIITDK